MAVYRPRAVVELAIILEDESRDAQRTSARRAAGLATSSAAQAGALVGVGAASGLTGAQTAALQAATQRNAAPIEPDEVYSLLVNPDSVEVSRNSIRTADECTVTINNLDLPIDPRAIKSMRLSVFLWDAPVASSTGAELPPGREDSLAFIGFVDEPSVKLGDGNDTVKLKCRDYTAFFLDKKVPIAANGKPKRYNIDRPFREVVLELFDDIGVEAMAEVRSRFEARYPVSGPKEYLRGVAGDLTLPETRINGNGLAAPSLTSTLNKIAATATDKLSTRTQLYQNLGQIRGKTYWEAQDEDLWSVLSQMCDVLRILPFFEFDELIIEPISAVRKEPFVFRYGANIMDVTYKRNYETGLTRPVEVRMYNPYATSKDRRYLVAQYPPNGTPLEDARERKVADLNDTVAGAVLGASGIGAVALGQAALKANKAGADVTKSRTVNSNTSVVHLIGDYTQDQLDSIAYEAFIGARRNDFQGSLTTMDMEDLGLYAYDPSTFPGLFTAPTEKHPDFLNSGYEEAYVVQGEGFFGSPRSLVRMGNSDLIILDIPARTWEEYGIPGSAGIIRDVDGRHIDGLYERVLQILHESAKRKQAQLIPLYVKKAVHKYDSENGYTLSVDFTSPIGTDLED